MRTAEIKRKTKETDIALTLSLDGSGKAEIDTGVGFLNHMLTLFAAHGLFDLSVRCKGDTEVDDHHSTEDIGIALGQAFAEALGDKKGIHRFGQAFAPMDWSQLGSAQQPKAAVTAATPSIKVTSPLWEHVKTK